jgi:hypothetical protein
MAGVATARKAAAMASTAVTSVIPSAISRTFQRGRFSSTP